MRPTRIAALIGLWFLTMVPQLLAQESSAKGEGRRTSRVVKQGRTTVKSTVGTPESRLESWQAEGFGDTQSYARANALEKATAVVAAYLHEHGFDHRFEPTPKDVERLIQGAPQVETVELQDGNAFRVILRLELTPSNLVALQKRERDFRASFRLWSAGKVLAAVLAVLLALGGYFRLEDATRGYCTNWLRLGAISMLICVAACLFFLG